MSLTLEVSLEEGCMNQLLWRCDLPTALDLEVLLSVLGANGYSLEPQTLAGLYCVKDPQDHKIVIVERSGRVQIRVNYLLPHALRETAARVVGAQLERYVAAALRRSGGAP